MQNRPEVTMQFTQRVLTQVPFVSYWHESKPGDYDWSQNAALHEKRLDLLRATAWFSISPISQEYIKQFALWVLNAPSMGPIAAQRFRKQYDYAFSPFASPAYREEIISRALALQGKGPVDVKTGQEYPENASGAQPPAARGYMRMFLDPIMYAAKALNNLGSHPEREQESEESGDDNDESAEEDEVAPMPQLNPLQIAATETDLSRLMADVRISNDPPRFVARPGPEASQSAARGQSAMMHKRRGMGAEMPKEHDTTAAELWDSVESKLPRAAKLLLTSQLGLGLDPSATLKKLKTRDGKVDYLGAIQPKAKGMGQVMRTSGLGAPAYRKDKRLSPELASALLTVYAKLPQRQRKPFERLVDLVIKDLANVQSHTEKTEVNDEAASIIARLGLLNTIQTLNVSKRVQNVLASQLA